MSTLLQIPTDFLEKNAPPGILILVRNSVTSDVVTSSTRDDELKYPYNSIVESTLHNISERNDSEIQYDSDDSESDAEKYMVTKYCTPFLEASYKYHEKSVTKFSTPKSAVLVESSDCEAGIVYATRVLSCQEEDDTAVQYCAKRVKRELSLSSWEGYSDQMCDDYNISKYHDYALHVSEGIPFTGIQASHPFYQTTTPKKKSISSKTSTIIDLTLE